MFEKAFTARANRQTHLQPRVVSAAVAVHVLLAAGITAIPPEEPTQVSPDRATILLLYRASPPPALPALPRKGAEGASRTRALRAAVLYPAATHREEQPSDPVEPLFHAPETVAVVEPGNLPAMDRLRLRGLGEAGAVADSGASRAGSAGSLGAPMVDAELLAETPLLLNRREIARVLGHIYPWRFKVRGTQGEVVMLFIIGLDGRAELESARVLSATDPGFIEPTLRGLARMRFRPAVLDGTRVRVRARLPVHWVLAEG